MSAGKRLFDLSVSLLGLVVTAPVLAGAAILIKLEDGGPVFFRQERVGRHGRRFLIWKLRTMVSDAERRSGQLTVGSDDRITRIGRWLRRAKLDELPQLFNVVGGTMSLVGPRPEVPRYVELYTDSQQSVLEMVPGITDPASIEYRDEAAILAASEDPERTYIDEIMPEKIRLNLEYAQSRTGLWSDVRVILRTLAVLIRR
jgi:lipopolysaccharide/colanic/teichoic acid biosynthesis glycosyltransferase